MCIFLYIKGEDKMYALIIIWNTLVFILYGLDKIKAKNKMLRIPESILLLFSFLFGGIGAMFGMVIFNHKTSKMKFRVLVPISVVLNILFLGIDYAAIISEFISKLG